MRIEITNRQKSKPVNRTLLKKIIAEAALKMDAPCGDISVVVVDDATIKTMHRDFFDDDTVTDVITFPLTSYADDGYVSGEIIVSLERALDRCGDFGTSPEEEFALYLIHSFLHLMGYEDHPAKKRAVMKKIEDRLFNEIRSVLRLEGLFAARRKT
jgi:probable rRNA maturation factor